MKNWKVSGKLQNQLIHFVGYWKWGISCHSIQKWNSLWGHFEWGWKRGQSDLATRQKGPFAPWARTPHHYWHYSWSISTHFHWNRQVTCTYRFKMLVVFSLWKAFSIKFNFLINFCKSAKSASIPLMHETLLWQNVRKGWWYFTKKFNSDYPF